MNPLQRGLSSFTIDRKYFDLTRKASDQIDILFVGGEVARLNGSRRRFKVT